MGHWCCPIALCQRRFGKLNYNVLFAYSCSIWEEIFSGIHPPAADARLYLLGEDVYINDDHAMKMPILSLKLYLASCLDVQDSRRDGRRLLSMVGVCSYGKCRLCLDGKGTL